MQRRSTFRLLALVLCHAFCLALLVAWNHQVVAHHGYCSEHGELIHLPAAERPLSSQGPWHRGVDQRPRVTGAHGCPVLTFLTTPLLETRSDRGVSRATGLTRKASPAGTPPAPSIPLLHQAPKASPPRS